MKPRVVALMVSALLAISVGMASAQGGPGGRRGGMMGRMGGGLALLRSPAVQKELKMTDAQTGKLDAKQQEVQSQMQELMQNSGGFQNMSPEDRQKLFEKVQDIQHKAVADILDNAQLHRFDQLELQRQGPSALARKDIADKLKLSDEQRAKLAAIQQKAQSDMRSALQGKNFRDLSDADRQQMQTIQKTANESSVAVLTENQQKQWKEMQGAPFDFGSPAARRPPGA